MYNFFDSNVMIGYIYSLDPLNKVAKKAITKDGVNYYSEHVKSEVNKVVRRKNREYDSFFRRISNLINKSDDNSFVDLSQIHNAVSRFKPIGKLEVKDMHIAVEVIWQELGFDENTDAFKVKSDFDNYWDNFHSKHRNCKKHCFQFMECIPAHSQKDKTVLAQIDKKSLRRDDCLHAGDEDILFDVHEYIKQHPELDLLFVSGDEGFVRAISVLIDVLAFNKYKYLDEFLNN